MSYTNRMNEERTDTEALVRLDLVELRSVEKAVLLQFAFYQSERELRAINRNIQLGENPRKSTDVVFMAVGEQDGANFAAILQQVGYIGNNDVHSEQF